MITYGGKEIEIMKTWDEYKRLAKASSPDAAAEIEKAELTATLLCDINSRFEELGYSRRDFARICDVNIQTISRVMNYDVTLGTDTLGKILERLRDDSVTHAACGVPFEHSAAV